ncbi:UDP-2,3-diacylglucosamine diphosphatase [Parathalassolituus penaei]|uniref:UDP-2,3-diacylglucosamine hydrolase n=1 Tax=Parathalassolituus penaei TaxID=2997323 RepID=A0A9X3EF75_9GAMM|nr:UDP-2,3-diacylglucosamine diphosphatase [Parathalassolituus penaei]MCY0966419.1 UDP-2,3-diacylglucosamine diphosphatase [Parathalassolituus penaei]
MTVYFISDLHLEPSRPALADGFLRFINSLTDAEALYILGDFFEVWIGDDLQTPFTKLVEEALRGLSERGCKVYIMHGNRDFLLGQAFCQRAGASLIDEGTCLTLGNERILLLHGDSLCTADVEYIKMRGLFRSPTWQQQILSKTIEERIAFARQVRDESQRKGQMQSIEIMDVTQDEVVNVMQQADVHTLLHGHTHRPAVHHWQENGQSMTRMVLGDWSDQQGWMARWTSEDGLQLSEFEL